MVLHVILRDIETVVDESETYDTGSPVSIVVHCLCAYSDIHVSVFHQLSHVDHGNVYLNELNR